MQDRSNLRIDPQAGVIQLSTIFDWYERDFTNWVATHRPELPETLFGYLRSQLREPDAARLESCQECRVEFIEYDWSLNEPR